MADKSTGAQVHGGTVISTVAHRQEMFRGVEAAFVMLLESLGFDLNDPHFKDTPRRAAKAWITELCAGHLQAPPSLTSFPSEDSDGLVILTGIPVKSLCAHHLLPFTGTATVAYIPAEKGQIIGLSKLSRIVDFWARRPQVQERLTKQIADYLMQALEPAGVGVVIRCAHTCMSLRGVNHEGDMITSELRGIFRDQPETRAEFMALAREK